MLIKSNVSLLSHSSCWVIRRPYLFYFIFLFIFLRQLNLTSIRFCDFYLFQNNYFLYKWNLKKKRVKIHFKAFLTASIPVGNKHHRRRHRRRRRRRRHRLHPRRRHHHSLTYQWHCNMSDNVTTMISQSTLHSKLPLCWWWWWWRRRWWWWRRRRWWLLLLLLLLLYY